LSKRLNLAMAAFWKRVKANFDLGDIVFLAAVAALAYGVQQIYEPAAWIVVGLIFMIVTGRKPSGGEP